MVIDLRYDAASICLYSLGAIAGYARGASEIGDDDGGDILNIINSRSDDEGRDGWRGAARIINTEILLAPGASLSLANVSRPLAPILFSSTGLKSRSGCNDKYYQQLEV